MKTEDNYEQEIMGAFPDMSDPCDIHARKGIDWFIDTIHARVVKEKDEEIERLTNEIARMEGEFSTEAFHESERNKKAIDLIGRCIIQFGDGTPDELEILGNDINAFLNPKD